MDNLKSIFDDLDLQSHFKSGSKVSIVNFTEFLQAIDWSEHWLMALMAFHLLMVTLVVLSRKSVNAQCVLGIGMLTVVYLSENINELAALNWRLFAGQQYFDTNGLFISTVMSGPLLFNCLIIIINFLLHNFFMLRDIQHLKAERVMKKSEENNKGDGANDKKSSTGKKED